jgi:hypothetical protein
MKISKAKLQQLILEEVAKHKKLSEDAVPDEVIQNMSISDALAVSIKALAIKFKSIVEAEGGTSDERAARLALAVSQFRKEISEE